jgi:hypothetical protein
MAGGILYYLCLMYVLFVENEVVNLCEFMQIVYFVKLLCLLMQSLDEIVSDVAYTFNGIDL